MLFLKGLLLGFAIAAPVGPIGILCIRKTLHYGRLSGFFTGLGAAAADTIYGAIAITGLTALSSFLLTYKHLLQLAGGIFLAYLALSILRAKTPTQPPITTHKTLLTDFGTTFLLTLTNPMTILSFVIIFAGIGFTEYHPAHTSLFILGVFLGSALWWLILSEGVFFLRTKISPHTILWINRSAAILLLAFSAWFLIAALVETEEAHRHKVHERI